MNDDDPQRPDTFRVDTSELSDEQVERVVKPTLQAGRDEISVHDNLVYAYLVLSEQRKLILFTEYHFEGSVEYTDVVFTGVVGHHFLLPRDSNILFDIEEHSLAGLVHDYHDLFDWSRSHVWPVENNSTDDLVARLEADNIKAYRIDSSWGLGGWVLAKDMQFRPRTSKRAFDPQA